MADWSFLQRPDGARDDAGISAWFAAIAGRLLNGSRLIAGGEALRITEVEFYHRSAEHPDPFPHADPIQHQHGMWYFHKSGGGYRGGSYKGVDLTFGDERATGGILIRGVETADAKLIDGPSLTVDYLLGRTQAPTVRALDERIGRRAAWNPGNPLRLIALPRCEELAVWRSARAGLSLKRAAAYPDMHSFIGRPYRFLTEPRSIRKGKRLLVGALLAEGCSADRVRELTGATLRTIRTAEASAKRR